eukprot:TRINITY_DN35708_c0_g1_i1.p1 TRINITY_DN35708_c0_g1~~TRINITY_DN35708_c0_g1_i1.p1  ORF type:complete len:266 (-),score=20.68 TRINITY_DN35708_c0_g1_i1:58-855(-)
MCTLADGSIATTSGESVITWNPKNGDKTSVLEGEPGTDIYCLAAVGSRIISGGGGERHAIRIWGETTSCLHGHDSMVLHLATLGESAVFASGCSGSTVRLWDGNTESCTTVISEAHGDGWVHGIAFIDKHTLATSSDRDNAVRLWDLRAGTRSIGACGGHGDGEADGAWQVCALDSRGSGFVSTGTDGFVRLWDLRKPRYESTLLEGRSEANCGANTLIVAEQTIVSGDSDGVLRSWDVASGEAHRPWKVEGPVQALTLYTAPAS